MRGCGDAENRSQENDARPPFAARPLHGVRDSDAGVDGTIDAQRREDFWRRSDASFQNWGAKTVERQRRVAAEVAVEPARDPPEAAAQHDSCKEERQAEQQQNMRELMAELPGTERLRRAGLNNAIFGLAEDVKGALGQQVERERQTGETISEDAIANITAGGEVADDRRGLLPGFTAAARVLIVAIGERLAACDPKSLAEKKQQENGGHALRKVETEST